MKIYNKIIIDIETGETLYEDSFEYDGPIAECSGGGGGGGDQTNTIRYAPYIESKHQSFLTAIATYRAALTDSSPYDGHTDIITEAAFFGTGYIISSFPSLYDMYGKFMAGLDIDSLYNQIFADATAGSQINDLVSAEAALLDDDIADNILPRFQVGMRDINAVMTSSFVTGKALIEDSRLKAIAKFSAELRYRMIAVATDRFRTHLEWNKSVTMNYAEIMKLYYSVKMDVDDYNYSMAAKDTLWPFTVLDHERAALGALQGATSASSESAGSSKTARALSGALSGAATGFAVSGGNPIGAVAGGVIGLAAGLM